MTADTLTKYFDHISEAPDAVARLRRFILDLAVRGKLVEQDFNDEPANELLKRIQAENARLVRSGKAGKEKSLVGETEVAFAVPNGWEWAKLGQICSKTGSGSTPRGGKEAYLSSGVPFLRSQNVHDDGLRLDTVAYISDETHQRMKGTAVLPGDLLLNITGGSIGRCARVPDDFSEGNISQHVAILRLALNEVIAFTHLSVISPYFQNQIISAQTGAGRLGLPKNRMDGILIPIPPLAEQHRIVAKVAELMALCDQLEAARNESEVWRDRLVASSLHRIGTATAMPVDTRFHLEHLPQLTTRPEHIKQLRQAILNLAVCGCLVSQDPNDEPARDLLKLIQAEKVRLAKEGKYRGSTVVRTLAEDAAPFLVPMGWAWASFGEIMISRDGERIPVSKEERNTRLKNYDYYGASGVIDKIDSFLFDKPLLLIGEDGANLVNRSTPIAFIARGKYWVNNHAHVLDGISEDFLRFIELHINAIDLKPFVTGTAQPKMNQAKMNSIPIALPPVKEQHRIVAKVDELMALCSQLEAQLGTTQTDSCRLLEAVLRDALTPPL